MLSDSWFQAAGPVYEKARSPTLVFRRGYYGTPKIGEHWGSALCDGGVADPLQTRPPPWVTVPKSIAVGQTVRVPEKLALHTPLFNVTQRHQN